MNTLKLCDFFFQNDVIKAISSKQHNLLIKLKKRTLPCFKLKEGIINLTLRFKKILTFAKQKNAPPILNLY